ncbi:MAG: phosphatase PAP2 family protein [Bdellovibrionales bacterium]|nr:phosphatase PAP2 family protein [Bdellovibrionales bacterium]
MSESLWNLDLAVLKFLNVTLASSFGDVFWDTITHLDRVPWFQFVVFPLLLAWLIYIYRGGVAKVLVAMTIAIALTDTISYRVVKKAVDRPRPFNNPEISSWVRKVGHAHGPSFPSNHAANCFAGATVLSFYFRRRRYFFYSFAGLIALSRPALGVHYPSDVIAGAILGFTVAKLVEVSLFQRVAWFQLAKPVSKTNVNSGV